MKRDRKGAQALPDCRDCSMGRHSVYREVLRVNPARVASCRSHVIQHGPGRVLVRQENPPSAIYTVRKGWLYRYRNLGNGRQQIISFIIPGDMITFSSVFNPDTPLFYGIKSATHVELCSFDCGSFRQGIAADPAFTGPYRRALSGYLDTLHRRIADIGQRSARGRMAQLLMEFHERHLDRGLVTGSGFDFPISQELLARALGLTKAYVNRTLSAFKDEGLIQLRDRQLRIPDPVRLRDLAESE